MKNNIRKFIRYFSRAICCFLKLAAVVMILFLTFWLIIIPIGNEVILRGYVKDLQNTDIGCDYEVIEWSGACGKLYGNGNGMEYLAVALITCEEELTEKEFSLDYGTYLVRTDNEEELAFVFDSHYSERTLDIKAKVNELEDFQGYYILYSLNSADMDSIWTWDLRGH